MLNTLSHLLSQTAPGYYPLSDFPEVAPSGETRNTVVETPSLASKPGNFFEEDESSEGYTTSEGEEGWTSDEEGEYTTSEGEEWISEDSEDEPIPQKSIPKKAAKEPTKPVSAPKDATSIMDDLFSE